MKLTGHIPEAVNRRREDGGDFLFTPRSKSSVSPLVTVINNPISITAYGLTSTDSIEVHNTIGGLQAPFVHKGVPLVLTAQMNSVSLRVTGTYVLVLNGALGAVTVNATEVKSLNNTSIVRTGPQPSGAAANRPNTVLELGQSESVIIDVMTTATTLFRFGGAVQLFHVVNSLEAPVQVEGSNVEIQDSVYQLLTTGRYKLKSAGDAAVYAVPNLVSTFDPYPDRSGSIVVVGAATDGDILEFASSSSAWIPTKQPRLLYLDGGNF